MAMTLDELPIERGLNMFLCRTLHTGKKKWVACEVRDVCPHTKAVKVLYPFNKTKMKSEWFPLTLLAWKEPVEEVAK